MTMEALLMRAAASFERHGSALMLSLPQSHCPVFSRAVSARCSSALHKRASAITTKTMAPKPGKYGTLPVCHCCAASSALSADQRLDFTLSVGSVVIPHPAKAEKGGEDAFFVSNHNGGTLGIADGVSGWAEENIDPALFSRELMEHAVAALDGGLIGDCPKQLLTKAYEATSAIGAATVIVAILEREGGVLHVANLGDCGLRLVRKGSIFFATSTQEHYFDCPYQLSSEPGAQTSVDALVYKVELLPGDIIIMGSDGLFDNVYDKDIEKTARLFEVSDSSSPQKIASALASLASKHAKDLKYESPYSKEAALQGYDLPFWKKILGQKLTGGKLDDITVLTAQVVATPTLPKVEPVVSSEDDTSFLPQVVATPTLPKVEPVVPSEDDTSFLPQVVAMPTLPEVEPVVPSKEDTPQVVAAPSLPKVEPVTPMEEDSSFPTQIIAAPTSPKVEPIAPSKEDTLFAPQVAAMPTLPKVEHVVLGQEDASVSPAEETPSIDTTAPNELLAPAA